MARAFVKQDSHFPYHITGRCSNKLHFHLNLDSVWAIMEDYLFYSNKKHGLKIHSFVLMPNHFHLLASISQNPIGEIMREFLTNTSKEMNFMSGRINQNWGSKHFKCELKQPQHFLNTYKYVYQNPVRAKLSNNCESWKYSTLSGLLGFSKLAIPVEDDGILFNPDFCEQELFWLNKPISSEDSFAMKIALRRKEFKLPKVLQRMNHLESERI